MPRNKISQILDYAKSGSFNVSKRNDRQLIVEKQQVRIRFFDESENLSASVLLPFNDKSISLLSGARVWKGSRIKFASSDRVELTLELNDPVALSDIFLIAANAIALQEEPKLSGILKQIPDYSGEVSQESLSLLKSILEHSKVVIITADLPTLYSALRSLDYHCLYEVNPLVPLVTVSEQLSALHGLNGSLILFNMSHISEDNAKSFLAAFESYFLDGITGGARFLLNMFKHRLPSSSLPQIKLRSIFDPIEDAVSSAGLNPDLSTLSSISLMMQDNNLELPEAIRFQQELAKYSSNISPHKTSLRLDFTDEHESHTSIMSDKSLNELLAMGEAIIEEHVVGTREMHFEILRGLALWWLMETIPRTILFAGPTASGKNHLSEVISLILSKWANKPNPSFTVVNCGSLIGGSHALWALKGVQSGLKGANRKGLLEQLETGTVLMFDEFEKANEEVGLQPFLMDLLDQNSFINGMAEVVRLPAKCLFILAMNAGTERGAENFNHIGFNSTSKTDLIRRHYVQAYEKLISAPLRGRIDEVFFFEPLTRDDFKKIARREIDKIERMLLRLGTALPSSKDHLAEMVVKEADLSLGARAIKNRVKQLQREIVQGKKMGE